MVKLSGTRVTVILVSFRKVAGCRTGGAMVDVDALVSRGVDGLEVPNGHAIHPLLQPLFPGGLMPAVYRLDGASSVGLGLLTHGWCGVVGLPELSVEAARQWGVELSRLVLVPDSREIPRVPRYSGQPHTSATLTVTGLSPTPVRLPRRFTFTQHFSLANPAAAEPQGPHNPAHATPAGLNTHTV